MSFLKGPSDGEDDEDGDPFVEEVDVATGNRQAQHSRLLKFVTAGSATAKSTVSERPQHSEDKSDLQRKCTLLTPYSMPFHILSSNRA